MAEYGEWNRNREILAAGQASRQAELLKAADQVKQVIEKPAEGERAKYARKAMGHTEAVKTSSTDAGGAELLRLGEIDTLQTLSVDSGGCWRQGLMHRLFTPLHATHAEAPSPSECEAA